MPDMNEQISTLNTLIATTIDSINGFENSAKEIENQNLAQIFRERANERQQVVEQLRSEVRRLGGEPESDGSFMGKAHQRWEDLKSAVAGGDEKAIVNEVERAYQKIREGHDQISSLKHGMQTQS